jgi:ketosteroid isomerase-like protein
MQRSFAALRMTCVLVLVIASSAAFAQNSAEAQKAAIRQLLEKQVDAWNRGDLEGFMAGYWNSPELTFFSGDKVTRGWQATLERYRRKYQGTGKEMGKLDFFDLQIEMLGPEAADVQGHWHLIMKNKQELGGLFTLILRKFPDGWKIVHDHTS